VKPVSNLEILPRDPHNPLSVQIYRGFGRGELRFREDAAERRPWRRRDVVAEPSGAGGGGDAHGSRLGFEVLGVHRQWFRYGQVGTVEDRQ
jgi:hypothetical protein